MTRPLRIQYEDALYHVTARGNEKADIYHDDKDRHTFIRLLADVVGKHRWMVYAYCLMGNHYHILVRTPEANLSDGMRQLNGVYAQYFNRRHRRVGHLFQGRFSAILIKDEQRLLTVARYVVLNPIRAGLVGAPEEWRWSSYRATAGMTKAPSFLHPDPLLSFFSDRREPARVCYTSFVKEGIGGGSPLSEARGGMLAGGDGMIELATARLMGEISDEVPSRERFADRPTLEELFRQNTREIGIFLAFFGYGYRLREIGDFLGLHYSSISRIANGVRSCILPEGDMRTR